ncbi:MAG: ABC transporter permease [Lachnospiraceae bacterium]|nr:ABC transporter permease [Lachnospiraceae bacterium]
MKNKKPLAENQMFLTILASVISIAAGLLFGSILLFILNPAKAGIGITAMLTTGFSSLDQFGKVLYQSAPLMLCGLSVGFAFKTGMFNIGATGQYTIGAFCALLGAIALQLPWWLCLMLSLIGGAVWGIFPGLFKALFNVNEVITSIMFNWIAMFLVNLLLANMPIMLASAWGASNSDRTANLAQANKGAIIPKGGLDRLFGNSSWINISVFIAILFAVICWFILEKTTFGYELKACGYNKESARYAGINANRNIVSSMIIAGSLSGLGGGVYYLAGTIQYVLEKKTLAMGFNGIPVALLANSNPIGTIFSSLFISYIQVGGSAMQPNFSSESTDIIIAVIIYLAAFALLMKGVIQKILKGGMKQEAQETVSAGDAKTAGDKTKEAGK